MARKRIYHFAKGSADGRAAWRALLGGKGANLAEMAQLGIPVPPGFTLTTEVCVDYLAHGRLPDGLLDEVRAAVARLEALTDRRLGDTSGRPLLLSVRSGAPVSMPGMMDTVLDLGLNADVVAALAATGEARFAYDAFRRLLAMYGDVVLGVDAERIEAALDDARRSWAAANGRAAPDDVHALRREIPDPLLEADQLKAVCAASERIIEEATGLPFPADPYAQLRAAIEAVFDSWNTPRARLYREMHAVPEDWGTAVNVQVMVFGNRGADSATGVAFTRDPATGERRFFGEWLPDAQGEDVVAGVRTPGPLAKDPAMPGRSLEEAMPARYAELVALQGQLEAHFRDMQDLEFTIEDGELFILQTRDGKRTARAAVRIAVEMVDEGLLHPDEAILRVDADRLGELLFPTIDPATDATPVTRCIAASPGAVRGVACFDADAALAASEAGASPILVRALTSPEDLHGMKVARGILTARGGATSHAAVVARGMGRPCVTGCGCLDIDEAARELRVHGADGAIVATITAGQALTIDGTTGAVYLGEVATVPAALGEHTERLLAWCDRAGRMAVRANADTPEQARVARALGAAGIGLCRTEHMFFDAERIDAFRALILAGDAATSQKALDAILPLQVADFEAMFRVMGGLPVTIRLLDPPLHEFLPHEPAQLDALAKRLGLERADVEQAVDALQEANPMLGLRGVRLAIHRPEIPAMQIRAILTAASRALRDGVDVRPEIMVPLALGRPELDAIRAIVDTVRAEVQAAEGVAVPFHFGTMIELPRAAVLAGELAGVAEFFSFGTNDLTQTTMGLSRDDAGRFLSRYVGQGLLPDDPFVTLDRAGVGALIELAVERGRATRSDLHLGVCGEHGGDPRSIDFCEGVGLDYVSCSPMRVPVARIAVAQAALRRRRSS